MKMAERTEEQHTEKMKKKQAAHDQIVAAKTIEKGLLIVHTGKGKGKTTAALGMVVRAIGHGKKIGVVQFVKGAMTTGRSEEHTSELQSLMRISYAVFCLKKKKTIKTKTFLQTILKKNRNNAVSII